MEAALPATAPQQQQKWAVYKPPLTSETQNWRPTRLSRHRRPKKPRLEVLFGEEMDKEPPANAAQAPALATPRGTAPTCVSTSLPQPGSGRGNEKK